MIIIYELVDFIKVIRIKMFALNAEVSFDRFGKELCFIGVCLGDFVVMAQCWIAALLTELQNFSQLACVSTLRSSLTCFCN